MHLSDLNLVCYTFLKAVELVGCVIEHYWQANLRSLEPYKALLIYSAPNKAQKHSSSRAVVHHIPIWASRAQLWVGLPQCLTHSLFPPSQTYKHMVSPVPQHFHMYDIWQINCSDCETFHHNSNVDKIVGSCTWYKLFAIRSIPYMSCQHVHWTLFRAEHIDHSSRLLNKLYIVQCASMSNCQGLLCPHPHPDCLSAQNSWPTKQSSEEAGEVEAEQKGEKEGWTLRVKQSNKGDHCLRSQIHQGIHKSQHERTKSTQ